MIHGHVQGMLSSVQGGNYGTSFLSGAIGSGFSSGATSLNLGDGGVILSGGLSSGVGSALSGGNFFEGFGQGATIALANHLFHGGGPTKLQQKTNKFILKANRSYRLLLGRIPNLSETEVNYLSSMTKKDILQYNSNINDAVDARNKYFPNQVPDNNHANAFTHAYLASLHRDSFGSRIATELVNMHETGQNGVGTQMDARNNQIGLTAYSTNPQVFYQMATSGRLWVLSTDGNRILQTKYGGK